jgi:hypothetical protein
MTSDVGGMRGLTADEMDKVAGGIPPGILIAVNVVPESVPPHPHRSTHPHRSGHPILDKLFGRGGGT